MTIALESNRKRRSDLIATTTSRSTMNTRLTDTELSEMFRQWWMESYPTPPGTHAQITHLGWARHLLNELGEPGEPQAN